MSGTGRPIDRAITHTGSLLEEIERDLPRLRRYKKQLELNIVLLEQGIADEEANPFNANLERNRQNIMQGVLVERDKIDHVDNMLEVLEAKEIQTTQALEAQRNLQGAIDRGLSE